MREKIQRLAKLWRGLLVDSPKKCDYTFYIQEEFTGDGDSYFLVEHFGTIYEWREEFKYIAYAESYLYGKLYNQIYEYLNFFLLDKLSDGTLADPSYAEKYGAEYLTTYGEFLTSENKTLLEKMEFGDESSVSSNPSGPDQTTQGERAGDNVHSHSCGMCFGLGDEDTRISA